MALLLVKVTLPPTQKLVGPFAVIVGTAGLALTVTTIGFEGAELHPNALATTE